MTALTRSGAAPTACSRTCTWVSVSPLVTSISASRVLDAVVHRVVGVQGALEVVVFDRLARRRQQLGSAGLPWTSSIRRTGTGKRSRSLRNNVTTSCRSWLRLRRKLSIWVCVGDVERDASAR